MVLIETGRLPYVSTIALINEPKTAGITGMVLIKKHNPYYALEIALTQCTRGAGKTGIHLHII